MTGLVLEGGAMRGLFTSGILDVMMENDITFDAACGTSAGATFGCNIKSHQIGRAIRYNLKYCRDWRLCSIRSLILTGDMYGAEFAYRKLPEELDIFDTETFSKDPMQFYVTATDNMTGETVYHRLDDGGWEDIEWIRASASMPMVSRPVKLEGRLLTDGGTSDSIPLKFTQSLGCEKCVVILTQPAGFVKQPNSLLPLMRITLKKYPGLLAALENRHNMYNDTLRYIEAEEKAGRIYVIRPEGPLNIGAVCHEPAELQRVYDLGVVSGKKHLAAIKAFLS